MTRREELIVGLLRNNDLGSLREGVRGDDGAVGLLPHEAKCQLRVRDLRDVPGQVRCTCWLKSIAELARCLRLMRQTQRPLWYAVHERYVACERRPMLLQVRNNQPLITGNMEVIGLVNKIALNTKGHGVTRILVETWRPGLDPHRITQGVAWLAGEFRGAPELPRELVEAAA